MEIVRLMLRDPSLGRTALKQPALRIRLRGSAGKSLEKSLEEMLEAADDLSPDRLGEAIAKAEREHKPSLDDLLSKEPKPKPDWPS